MVSGNIRRHCQSSSLRSLSTVSPAINVKAKKKTKKLFHPNHIYMQPRSTTLIVAKYESVLLTIANNSMVHHAEP